MTSRTEKAIDVVRAAIDHAKKTKDPVAAIEAIDKFFAFFVEHTHTYRQDSGDPYVPDHECTTSGPEIE